MTPSYNSWTNQYYESVDVFFKLVEDHLNTKVWIFKSLKCANFPGNDPSM